MTEKKKIGIFSYSCCDGCQVEILDLGEKLIEISDKSDITAFPLAKAKNEKGPFDIAIVEGSITKEEEITHLKEIREKSKILVAIGCCAVLGGIPSLKNFLDKDEFERQFYKRTVYSKNVPASPIDKYVKVDFYVRGCPINKDDFYNIITKFINEENPEVYESPVCVECKKNKNPCLLVAGEMCFGPITYGGCNSVCTNNRIPCTLCRGVLPTANVAAEVALLKKKGYSISAIKKKMTMFNGNIEKLRQI